METQQGPASHDKWVQRIDAALHGGELLSAYDVAESALAEFPDDPTIRYKSVLILARAGATRQARAHYRQFGLGERSFPDQGPAFELDVAALDCRIAKDEALAAPSELRPQLLAKAAADYESLYRRTSDYYPGINAATLTLLCGQREKAVALAQAVREACRKARTSTGANAYYIAATEAEAALIAGDLDQCADALAQAAGNWQGDFSALATTRRQLRLVCRANSLSAEVLTALAPPAVVHYVGHIVGPKFPAVCEPSVREAIAATLNRLNPGFGYGSLAAGADILFAESLLARGAELNLTFPFDIAEFKQISVAPAGGDWLARFDACIARARSVSYATTDEYLGDDVLFGYSSRLAMGLALLRASFLDARVSQVAVWDGKPSASVRDVAGTAVDVACWRGHGLPAEIITPRRGESAIATPAIRPARPAPAGRVVRAMLFGDIKGLSKLREVQLPAFAREVLGRFARVLDRHAGQILFCNTWGDGLYVVARDALAAAACALELQDEMSRFVPTQHQLPETMGLRLGGHLGPVFELDDPVLKRRSCMGVHVSRTARIEPVTPEGAVYVTEAFAAEVALARNSGYTCEYVGQVPAAKHYGTMRMYSLRRSHSPVV